MLVLERRSQIGPFVPLVHAFDRMQMPSGRGRAAPVLATVPTPQILRPTTAAPAGILAKGLPGLLQSTTTKTEKVQ